MIIETVNTMVHLNPSSPCPSLHELSVNLGTALYLDGVLALAQVSALEAQLIFVQGYLFISIIWSASMVFIIDREFELAACWTMIAGVLSMIGLIHGYDMHDYDHGCAGNGQTTPARELIAAQV